MRRLGISIYPEHASLDQNKQYIDVAARHGFKRIFTCLLSVDKPKAEVEAEFKELIDFAHEKGMEVVLDVAPYVFDRLGISYDDVVFSPPSTPTASGWTKGSTGIGRRK